MVTAMHICPSAFHGTYWDWYTRYNTDITTTTYVTTSVKPREKIGAVFGYAARDRQCCISNMLFGTFYALLTRITLYRCQGCANDNHQQIDYLIHFISGIEINILGSSVRYTDSSLILTFYINYLFKVRTLLSVI